MTKSIIVVTICYKLLCHSSRFLISNFLASTDIKVFGRTYLFAMLLLIGLALFLHPGCFCLVLFTVTVCLLQSIYCHNTYLVFSRYLNSVNFLDIDRFMKLKCLETKKAPNIYHLRRLFMKIKLLKIRHSRNVSTSKNQLYGI